MASSTSPRGFSDRAMLVSGVGLLVGSPLVVLTLLQTNYVLAYYACADRSHSWLNIPSAIAVVVAVLMFGLAAAVSGGAARARRPLGFLSMLALMSTALSLLLVIAFAIPPLILQPCD